jgi:non-canonical (house-cleaning) NTP pyrophosphatase
MRNNAKSVISSILVLLLIAGIFAALPLTANAAPDPKPGDPAWDKKYADVVTDVGSLKPDLGPSADLDDNPRSDASGDKIPSNAHSADYPGLYFYWDDKQKEDGVLLVKPKVFDLFKDGQFILTAKNSNNYWGYIISPKTGTFKDDVYVYGIAKQFQIINEKNGKNDKEDLKNINMVFIDGDYKDAYFTIEKYWFDEEGNPIEDTTGLVATFSNGYTVGDKNKVTFTDYVSAAKGKSITVTENPITGFFLKETFLNGEKVQTAKFTAYPGDEAKDNIVKFHNQKQYAHVTVEKKWTGEFSNLPATEQTKLRALLQFDANFVFDLGVTQDIKGGTNLQVSEVIKDWEYTATTATQFVTYTVEWSPVEYAVTVEAGKDYTFTFVNTVVKTVVDKPASVTVVKEWNFGDLPVAQQDVLKALLEFDADFDFDLDTAKEVAAGKSISISEKEIAWTFVDDTDTEFVTYTIVCDDTEYAVTVEAGKDYTFTFVNTVVKTVTPKNGMAAVQKWIEVWADSDKLMSVKAGEGFGFGAYTSADKTGLVATAETDADGVATFSGLVAGQKYYVFEMYVPADKEGYYHSRTEYVTVVAVLETEFTLSPQTTDFYNDLKTFHTTRISWDDGNNPGINGIWLDYEGDHLHLTHGTNHIQLVEDFDSIVSNHPSGPLEEYTVVSGLHAGANKDYIVHIAFYRHGAWEIYRAVIIHEDNHGGNAYQDVTFYLSSIYTC